MQFIFIQICEVGSNTDESLSLQLVLNKLFWEPDVERVIGHFVEMTPHQVEDIYKVKSYWIYILRY
jgi:hypothetical protein